MEDGPQIRPRVPPRPNRVTYLHGRREGLRGNEGVAAEEGVTVEEEAVAEEGVGSDAEEVAAGGGSRLRGRWEARKGGRDFRVWGKEHHIYMSSGRWAIWVDGPRASPVGRVVLPYFVPCWADTVG
jgi:hypothetical protein